MLPVCDGTMQPLKTVLGWEDDIVSKVHASKQENLSLIAEPMLEKKIQGWEGRYERTEK